MLKKRVVSLLLICVLLTSLLPVPVRADDDPSPQEGELVRIEGKDNSFALVPTSGGTYCLWIYKDPFINGGFDDILKTIPPYIDKITTVCIGANVFYLSSSDNNPLSVCPNLTAYEVEAGNSEFLAIDGVLFQCNSDGTIQLKYYPPAKTDPFTLPDTTVWIDASAFDKVGHAEINVPGNLNLAGNSPISIASLSEIDGVAVNTIPTDDVASVTILFQDEPVDSLPTLDAGDICSLSSLVEPTGALPDVIWSSSNEAVATVEPDGTLTAVGKGSADITATTVGLKDLKHLSDSCTVQIRPRVTDVTITAEDGRTALIPGGTLTLSAAVAPEDANQNLIWRVSDPDVLSLSSDAGNTVTVTALSAGTATVTAASARYDTIIDTCAITVSTPVSGVTLNTGDFTLYLTNPVSESKQLTAAVYPEDASDPRVSWSSSNDTVATVSPTGLVSAVSKGTATITAVSEDSGEAASCVVTVREVDVAGLTIAPAALTLRIDPSLPTAKYGQLSVSLDPVNATDQDVTWTSLNQEIAAVDQNGKVTAVSGGETTILAASTHGADGALVTAQCKVTVELGGISIAIPEELELSLNKAGAVSQAALTATVEPAASTDALNWVSSNETVAIVDSDGKVTAVSEGSATITVICGGVKAACAVTVTDYQVKKFDALPQNVRVKVSETGTISAKLGPSHATDKAIVWTIDNGEVASLSEPTVAADGTSTVTVQGLKVGTATVTATSADNGSVVAACTVTVPEVKVGSLRLDSQTLTLYRNTPDGKSAEFPSAATLTLTVSPADTTNDVVWTSSNSAVVALGGAQYQTANNVKTGAVTLTAADGGMSVITATADGQTAQCTVNVIVLATGLTLNRSELALVKGTSAALIPTMLPANVNNRAVAWKSSDEAVATVDANGVVTAVAASGTATITATAKDGSGVSAACAVTAEEVPVKTVTVTPRRLVLQDGDASEPLLAVIDPSTAANTSVTWRSSNNHVASVTDGVVTAVGVGEAEIIVTTADGGKSDVCYVTVVPKPVEQITLSKSSIDVFFRETEKRTQTLTATVTPGDATDPGILWTSSNETVATVVGNHDGTAAVTLHAAGSAVITATSASNSSVSAVCPVTVRATKVASIHLDKSVLELDPLEDAALTATLTSDSDNFDPDNTAVAWFSSNETVATVDSIGRVTAVAAGNAVITARTDDGGFVATCVVRVWQKVTGVSLNEAALTMLVNDVRALSATVSPDNATDKAVTWESSNDEIVSVVDGTITAKGVGTATITATADGKSADCEITVYAAVTGVTISGNGILTLNVGADKALTATVAPEGDADSRVIWSSSDGNVATVNDNGTVSAVSPGTAVIAATSVANPGRQAFRTVKVVQPVTGITLSTGSLAFDLSADSRSSVLTAAITPSDTTDPVTWTITDSSVAQISAPSTASGSSSVTVYALKAGSTAVTVTCGEQSATCTVTVAKPVTGVSITEEALSFDLTMGSTLTLHAAVEPNGTAAEAVSWKSSNPAVATVSAHGVVTPIAPGTTSIEAATPDGDYSDSRTVIVKQLATGITLNPAALSLPVGRTAELTAALLGDPTNPNVNWSVSGTGVRVSDNGVVTAEAAGTATVIAAAADGSGVSKSCIVTVYEPVTSVAIQKDSSPVSSLSLTMVTDPAAQLSAVTPGGSGVTVVWSSTSDSVATVDPSGLVSAVGAGTATITAAATTGEISVSRSCTVTVRKAVISADTTTMTLTPAHNAANVVFSPWAAGTSLTWNVSGSSVTRTEGALNGSDKTYTISSLNNGVTTVSWSKAEDARYEASSGEITVFSVYDPITAVSVDRSKLATGSALTASVDQANRTIRVAGYVREDAGAYSLDGKLIFTPATGVIDGLSVAYDASSVIAKLNDSVICTYTLDRGGIVSLPDNVNVKTTLVAEENAAVSSIRLTNANISGEAAAVSAASIAASEQIQASGEADVTVSVALSPVSQKIGSVAGYNTVTLDITPQYTVTGANGDLIVSGTLSELPSAITIQMETAFQPSLIVHKHEDSVEYIPFTCIGPNEDGLYTVSWQQSTFSKVEFLDEAAAQQYLADQAKADEPANSATGGTGAPAGGAPAAAGGAQAVPAETAPKAFADVSPSHWAADAIGYASAHGIMNGMGDGSFAPEAAASRAMVAQILFNLTPGKAAGTQGFSDAAGTWYDEAARWAATCGIVTGIDGSFRGDDVVTREQLVTLLYRYAQFMGRDVSTKAVDYDRFTDAASVSPWASDAVRWAVGCGLIQGIGETLSPSVGATRAQIAVILMRFCKTASQ